MNGVVNRVFGKYSISTLSNPDILLLHQWYTSGPMSLCLICISHRAELVLRKLEQKPRVVWVILIKQSGLFPWDANAFDKGKF